MHEQNFWKYFLMNPFFVENTPKKRYTAHICSFKITCASWNNRSYFFSDSPFSWYIWLKMLKLLVITPYKRLKDRNHSKLLISTTVSWPMLLLLSIQANIVQTSFRNWLFLYNWRTNRHADATTFFPIVEIEYNGKWNLSMPIPLKQKPSIWNKHSKLNPTFDISRINHQ